MIWHAIIFGRCEFVHNYIIYVFNNVERCTLSIWL